MHGRGIVRFVGAVASDLDDRPFAVRDVVGVVQDELEDLGGREIFDVDVDGIARHHARMVRELVAGDEPQAPPPPAPSGGFGFPAPFLITGCDRGMSWNPWRNAPPLAP